MKGKEKVGVGPFTERPISPGAGLIPGGLGSEWIDFQAGGT